MTRREIIEFHSIQAIENVPSILRRGLLSHHRARSVQHTSVALAGVQDRREAVTLVLTDGTRRPLHSYANLYFHARNPMMFRLCRNLADGQRGLCVLRIDPSVLDIAGALVTAENAACGYARFFAAPGGIRQVDAETTFAEWWTDNNPIEQSRKKAERCAEILIPDHLPPTFITGAYVSCEASQSALISMGLAATTIDRHMFF